MFIGHYGTSFLAKTVVPEIPLWILFVAAQLMDILGAIFILAGVEKVRFVPGLPSNPLDLYFIPYSHSLLAAGFWSVVAFMLVYVIPKIQLSLKASCLVAGVVCSHWVLDLFVHRPDLWLVAEIKLGLGLWNFPILAFLLEIVLVVVTLAIYLQTACPQAHQRKLLILGIAMVGIQISTSFGPVPSSILVIYSGMLIAFFIFAGIAKYIEKSNAQQQS